MYILYISLMIKRLNLSNFTWMSKYGALSVFLWSSVDFNGRLVDHNSIFIFSFLWFFCSHGGLNAVIPSCRCVRAIEI